MSFKECDPSDITLRSFHKATPRVLFWWGVWRGLGRGKCLPRIAVRCQRVAVPPPSLPHPKRDPQPNDPFDAGRVPRVRVSAGEGLTARASGGGCGPLSHSPGRTGPQMRCGAACDLPPA